MFQEMSWDVCGAVSELSADTGGVGTGWDSSGLCSARGFVRAAPHCGHFSGSWSQAPNSAWILLHKIIHVPDFGLPRSRTRRGPQDTKIKDSAWPPCSHQCSCKYRPLLPHADKAALVPVLTQILLPQTIWNQLQIRYWFFTHTNRCPGWEHSLTETFHPHKVSSWWQFKENRKSYPIHYILWH